MTEMKEKTGMELKQNPINDAKVEAVLARLHQQAQRQTWRLALHFLPQLPRLALGRGVRWDAQKAGFMSDKYIAISPDQGKRLYLLARARRKDDCRVRNLVRRFDHLSGFC